MVKTILNDRVGMRIREIIREVKSVIIGLAGVWLYLAIHGILYFIGGGR